MFSKSLIAWLVVFTSPLGFVISIQKTSSFQLVKEIRCAVNAAVIGVGICLTPLSANAGMLTFPLPAPLKNNIVLMRAAECYADSRHEVQTNPVKKLRQDNALTIHGQDQAREAVKKLEEINFQPSFIWASNTERAYETAVVMAQESQLGQNRIIPEYSFLDARSIGVYEGQNDDSAWSEVHKQDELQGISFKPPPNNDGTPTESVSDVLVRGNQVISTIESMYSGENVVVIASDSDVLSILSAALSDENPDDSLPKHARFSFQNGEIRKLNYIVKPSEFLVTGQTQKEADVTYRKMRALRVSAGSKGVKNTPDTWIDLWHMSIDNT